MSNPAGSKYTFPAAGSLTASAALMCVPVAAIPFLRRFFEDIQEPRRWETREDWYRAYQVFGAMEAELMSGCLTELVESNNRLYRLLDTALNGTVYSASGDTPPVISPAIPAAPPSEIGEAPGLRRQLLDAQGILPGGWFGIGAAPATTADLVKAMRNDSQAQIDRAKTAFNALQSAAQGATIFGVVSDFLEGGAEITAEGGILATLLVGTMSQAAMMGLQAGQLDDLIAALNRVVASLDGGAEPRPDSNVLAELAGVNEKLV